ncbi:hypothetical protein P0D92_19535 [Pseudomonas sp. CBSPAW29]|nr:hypothetical protein P0D92_19535 [Pseudomonas sp. CBSPAW29]
MAEYLTQDLTVDLGDEMPEDTTLNMLQFASGKPPWSLPAAHCLLSRR